MMRTKCGEEVFSMAVTAVWKEENLIPTSLLVLFHLSSVSPDPSKIPHPHILFR